MLIFDLTKLTNAVRQHLHQIHPRLTHTVEHYVNTGSLLRDTAEVVRQIIIRRTREQHLDITGRKFADYNLLYSLWKQRRYGYSGDPNLKLTGSMLGDITLQQSSATKGKLIFASQLSSLKAAAHHRGLGHLPRRPFFGIRPNSDETEHLRLRIIETFRARLSNQP